MEFNYLWARSNLSALALMAIVSLPILAGVTFTANFPRADDFDVCLRFLQEFVATPHPISRLTLIFSPHNEHIIAFTRLIVLSQYFLFGSVNFVGLTVIGLTALAILGVILFEAFDRTECPKSLWFFSVFATVFQLRYFESLNWPMASLNTFWVMVFAMLALRHAAATKHDFFWALLWGSCAACTQGNGLLIFLVLSLLNLNRLQLRYAGVWLIVFLLWALLLVRVQIFSSSGVGLSAAWQYFDHGLCFLGTGMGLGSRAISRIWGVSYLCGIFYCTVVYCYQRSVCPRDQSAKMILLGTAWFVLLTAFANALARSQLTQDSLSLNLPSRYAFPALLGFGCLLCLAVALSRVVRGWGVLFAAVAFTLNIDALFQGFPLLRRSHDLTVRSQLTFQLTAECLQYPVQQQAATILHRAQKLAHFSPLELPILGWISRELRSPEQFTFRRAKLPLHFDCMSEGKDYLVLDGWTYRPGRAATTLQVLVMLEGIDQKRYLFTTTPTLQARSDGASYAVATGETGFYAIIPRRDLAPGEYAVKIVVTTSISDHAVSAQSKPSSLPGLIVDSGRTVSL